MCLACENLLNPAEVDAFAQRYLEHLNSAGIMMMASIGFRTGLFEALSRTGPATSVGLAAAAGLNERYVREWLGAMTTGRIVECDETGSVFSLPAAHAAMLTDRNGTNIGHIAQFISILGRVEDQIVACFQKGGGVPYAEYPRFHEVMAQDSGKTVVEALFDRILPLVPGLIERLERGIRVLDVGCGKGRALLQMAGRFPDSQFVGYDLCEEPIAWARTEAARQGLRNVVFVRRDLSSFHTDAPAQEFDLVTAFDAVHDQARPDHLLAGIRRTLKPGGVFLMQDIGAATNVAENRNHPIGPFMYTISCMHCMTVSLAQGGLGVGSAWGEELAKTFLSHAGFGQVIRHTLEHDIQNYYYIARP
jgi:ubiquinone/menaquinone biosynthesis C-methylase UbiE